MIALIDCNSFYCSCEAVFRPDLKNQPIVVLSNNDGCVIARNKEAKSLKIPMGAVVHKYNHIFSQFKVAQFSSNFSLYADFSSRIMNILNTFSPVVEVYSIDEAFIELPITKNYVQYAQNIRQTILQHTGIPVSIGIAETKVLAKCANYWAKKLDVDGVFALKNKSSINLALKKIPIQDVWGVGRKQAEKCKRIKINTAYDFKVYSNKKRIQTIFTKVGRQIQDELSEIKCLDVSDIADKRKNIQTSRSFKPELSQFDDIAAALSTFATKACEKLRRQNSCCNMISVFIQTNPFKDTPQYRNGISIGLLEATNDTMYIVKVAKRLLKQIYKSGYSYKKTGIILSDFTESDQHQLSLIHDITRNESLMKVLDTINSDYGRDTVQLASNQMYSQKKEAPKMVSPCYTTKWCDLLKVG